MCPSQRPSHAHYSDGVETETARLVAALRYADLESPVPSCPGWSLADLVRHLGSTHRWIEHIVRHRAKERVSPRSIDPAVPDDLAGYPGWLAAGAGMLSATLRATGPDTPLWTWGAARNAGWWSRRAFHETLVHRADAELSTGWHPAIEAETAADGIDELLANLPYGRRTAERLRGLGGSGETLHLHAVDGSGEWMVRLLPDGFTWERGHGKGTVAVQGATADLLLLVYGRLPVRDDRFTVFGDPRPLERWLEKSAL